MNKIFISHKREDSSFANKVCQILQRKEVNCYLDVLDNELEGDGEKLTRYLRSKLNECTHLLAVLTSSTRESWWVPFEIGLATERDYPISSTVPSLMVEIPDYLWKWPVLRNEQQINTYADMVLRNRELILQESMNKSIYGYKPTNYAEAFHRELKLKIGQP